MNLLSNLLPWPTGVEQLRQLIEMGGRPPIGEMLDIALIDAGGGFSAFEGHPSVAGFNAMGTVHGGYAAVLLDSACGCAGHSRLSATQAYTTFELKVAYHKPMDGKTGLLSRRASRVGSTLRPTALI